MTQGLKVGQLALFFGANDMGSLMIEENVVAEAGTVHYLTLDEIRGAISELGFVPRQRNVRYELLEPQLEQFAVQANRARYEAIRLRRPNRVDAPYLYRCPSWTATARRDALPLRSSGTAVKFGKGNPSAVLFGLVFLVPRPSDKLDCSIEFSACRDALWGRAKGSVVLRSCR